jgi:hypothetical protein
MTARSNPATVAGADIAKGTVIKARGRWYRVIGFIGDWTPMGSHRYRVASVVPASQDPRLATTLTGKALMIHDTDTYPTRDQPAPRWAHVDRQLAKEALQ